MARSSKTEPIEKFRFRVTFFSLKPQPPIETVLNPAFTSSTASSEQLFSSISIGNPFKTYLSPNNLISAGFSSVVPPKANISVIEYRENNHMNRTVKQPGLSSYEPVVLRKGVTSNQGLYEWYKEVHNDVYDLNSGNKIIADINFIPVHDPRFRREMVISALDREGKGVRHWLCINCFPISYKGGDSLEASAQEKLIEEITITYEAFVELKGDNVKEAFDNAQTESNKALAEAIEAVAIGAATGAIGGLF